MTLIGTMYDNFLPSDSERKKMFLDLWHDTLGELEYEDAEKALRQHFKESVYVPKIADIYQRVIAKDIPQYPDPVEQFNIVVRACGRFGQHRADEAMNSFNPITKRIVEMCGGFRKFCLADVDHEMSDRKHFVETYNRYIERDIKTIKNGGNKPLQLAINIDNNNLIDSKIKSVINKIE